MIKLALNNIETKRLTVKVILMLIIMLIFTSIILRKEAESLNREYIKQNTAVVGAVLQIYPELEEEIVLNFTREYVKNYDYGKEILKKYSYDENLLLERNSPVKSFYNKLLVKVLLMLFMSITLAYTISLLELNVIFDKIRSLSQFAEAVIHGDFSLISEENKEGDMHVFVHRLNLMANSLKENIGRLKKEKIFLKDTITDISHQLKTPISSLIMFNEIIKSDENMTTKEVNNFADMSLIQLERMEWLIKNLLKLARLDAGVVDFNIKEINIEQTIEKALLGLSSKASEKKQEISISGFGTGVFRHDSEWTSEALSNILKNSIEHTREGGSIEVSWEETPLSMQICIRDNGKGIPEKEIHKIFRRFYKGQSSENPGSVGVGLALAKDIIELQGGSVTAKSEEGVGTEIRISFLKTI